MRKVVIVGAGPAGLSAAIEAAEHGARVTVCEQLPEPGRKLLATGGGRCNLTNTADVDEMVRRFGRQGRFMSHALSQTDARVLRTWFSAMGMETICPDGVHVWPASQSARTVLTALLRRCGQLGIEILPRRRIEALSIEASAVRGVRGAGGPIEADAVVLAAGGRSWPGLGGTGGGYALARQAGHEIVPPTPALVALVTREGWPGRCAGISLSDVGITLQAPGRRNPHTRGDLIFTHRGISGPAVLDLSGDVAQFIASSGPATVLVEPRDAPGGDDPTDARGGALWVARLERCRESAGRTPLRAFLARSRPRALVDELCAQAGADADAPVAQLRADVRDRLAGLLAAMPLTVVATEGWGRAMVTRGGVQLKQVDPRTLASRRVVGLYFAGELLDLDGPCGGYNLQWAFASGRLAGRSAAQA